MVYDFESILERKNSKIGQSTTVTAEHHPISVAVSNNINEETICYVDTSPAHLVTSLLAYCNEVQCEAERRMIQRFKPITSMLDEYIYYLVS